jgi:hypothetical protein
MKVVANRELYDYARFPIIGGEKERKSRWRWQCAAIPSRGGRNNTSSRIMGNAVRRGGFRFWKAFSKKEIGARPARLRQLL